MCLAVPMRIVSIDDGTATIEVGGVTQRAGLMLVPEARVGDFVLVHAGYAITVLDAEEAAERERLFAELRDFEMHDAGTDDAGIEDAGIGGDAEGPDPRPT